MRHPRWLGGFQVVLASLQVCQGLHGFLYLTRESWGDLGVSRAESGQAVPSACMIHNRTGVRYCQGDGVGSGDRRGLRGLYLLVWLMANGWIGKGWSQRLRIGGQLTNLGLGGFPLLTLALARGRAIKNAQMVAEGGNPRTPLLPLLPSHLIFRLSWLFVSQRPC